MTNPNVTRWIGSVERLRLEQQSKRPFHQDRDQFYRVHPPMSTENWKQLQQFFDKRTEIENERFMLREKEKKLVDEFDVLNHRLKQVEEREVSTVEDEMKKNEEIKAINEEIEKVEEKMMKIREELHKKEEEIDRANEKINEMIEIVLQDEHKLNQQEDKLEREENKKKADYLKKML